MWVFIVAELVYQSHWGHSLQAEAESALLGRDIRVSSHTSMVSEGQAFLLDPEQALLLQCSARGRVSYPRPSEKQFCLNMTLLLQHIVSMTPFGNMSHVHYYKLQLQQEHRFRYGPGNNSGLVITMAICGNSGHPDQHGPL